MRLLPFKTPVDGLIGSAARVSVGLVEMTYVYTVTRIERSRAFINTIFRKSYRPDEPAIPDSPFPFSLEYDTVQDPSFGDILDDAVTFEYWEIPIFSGIRTLIEMLPDTSEGPIFPGGGSIKGDLEIIYYMGIHDHPDPKIPIPTAIEIPFLNLEFGVLYKDHYGNQTTWLGLAFKVFGVILAAKVLGLIFPYVSSGIIMSALMKVKHDKTKEILEVLGEFDVENGDTVSARIYRLLGTTGNEDLVYYLQTILERMGMKLTYL